MSVIKFSEMNFCAIENLMRLKNVKHQNFGNGPKYRIKKDYKIFLYF